MLMKNNIKTTVLITGGAGFIGRSIADEIAKNSSKLILVDIDIKNLIKIKNRLIKKYKNRVDIYECDMSDSIELNNLCTTLKKTYRTIDTIINAIGMVGTDQMMGWNEKYNNQSKDAWQKCLDINLTSIFFLIQKLHKNMFKSKNASITNISSIYGVCAPDWDLYKDTEINNPAAYSISKAGIVHMTKWLASTLGPKIRVNCVSPGGVYRNQSLKFIKKYESKTLLKRMATEKDIVGPVVFLSSPAASYITGINLLVDGGWTIK